MTIGEAIGALDNLIGMVDDNHDTDYDGAIKMAIDALKQHDRKAGKWIWLSSTYDRVPCEMRYMCSECHHETILHSNGMSEPWEKFCPNCGAEMRGRKNDGVGLYI